MYLIITLILCAITAVFTFIFTRSLYINHYKDWYRTAINSQDIDTESEQAAEKMYNTLASKYTSIFNIDHTIIPEYVKRTFEWGEDDMTKLNILRVCDAARWLGYDLTLTKRQLPPPPKFKLTASPTAIYEEVRECLEAEARNEKAN